MQTDGYSWPRTNGIQPGSVRPLARSDARDQREQQSPNERQPEAEHFGYAGKCKDDYHCGKDRRKLGGKCTCGSRRHSHILTAARRMHFIAARLTVAIHRWLNIALIRVFNMAGQPSELMP